MKNIAQDTYRALRWSALGVVAVFVTKIAVTMLLARFILPADFGVFASALIAIGFLQIFMDNGMGAAVVQRGDLTPAHAATAFSFTSLFGLVLSLAVYFCAPLYARMVSMPEVESVLRGLSILFFVRGVASASTALLRRALHFHLIARIELIAYLVGFGVCGLGAALAGWGVWALVLASVTEAVLVAFLAYLAAPVPSLRATAWKELFDLFSFSVGDTLAVLSNFFGKQIDKFVVGKFLGAHGLAMYSKAYHVVSAPTNLYAKAVSRVLFPSLSRLQQDRNGFEKAIKRIAFLTGVLALPASGFCYVTAAEIVRVILGPNWGEAVAPLRTLSLALFFRLAYNSSLTICRAQGFVFALAVRQGLSGLLIGFLAYMLWPGGIEVVAQGVLCALGVQAALILQLSLKGTSISLVGYLRALLPGFIMGVLVTVVAALSSELLRLYEAPAAVLLGVAATFCALAYVGAALLAARSSDANDMRWLGGVLRDQFGACMPKRESGALAAKRQEAA